MLQLPIMKGCGALESKLVPAWGVLQKVWGREPMELWFETIEMRNAYFETHKRCTKLPKKMINENEIIRKELAE